MDEPVLLPGHNLCVDHSAYRICRENSSTSASNEDAGVHWAGGDSHDAAFRSCTVDIVVEAAYVVVLQYIVLVRHDEGLCVFMPSLSGHEHSPTD